MVLTCLHALDCAGEYSQEQVSLCDLMRCSLVDSFVIQSQFVYNAGMVDTVKLS